MQLLIYMKILKKAKGVLIYENKNNHELLVFPIEVTDNYRQWIENTFEWMRVVRQAWKDKTLPQKNYRSNSKICKGCPVKTVCFTAEPGVIKIKSMEGLSETV
jgi:CRISPR/Cas system-associated exonuclease Cas4 (RecB family)